MDLLSIFALIILIVIAAAAVAFLVGLAILPGRIAKERGHAQADAVRICGYWGAITLGILTPLAFIWAYWDHGHGERRPADEATQ